VRTAVADVARDALDPDPPLHRLCLGRRHELRVVRRRRWPSRKRLRAGRLPAQPELPAVQNVVRRNAAVTEVRGHRLALRGWVPADVVQRRLRACRLGARDRGRRDPQAPELRLSLRG